MHAGLPMDKRASLRLEELDAMDEKRLMAQQSLELYRIQMTKAYDKMVRPRAFKEGDLVFVLRRPILGRHHGPKFAPNWEGPYIIKEVYEGGSYKLVDKEGKCAIPPINDRYLKKYYT
ncbi:hypothetical protein LUZ61_012915 [Rhynchospora tenuis]|uniref:Uncharacterized protein n=1 Tax=Rhynchospora tenuis TaxID=198213 RepID=A0AAD6F1X4_9POAL|nr:hypothetical protein LUZ61_012915 [Rhynchospora tenuis]